jgi:hypothetical protein
MCPGFSQPTSEMQGPYSRRGRPVPPRFGLGPSVGLRQDRRRHQMNCVLKAKLLHWPAGFDTPWRHDASGVHRGLLALATASLALGGLFLFVLFMLPSWSLSLVLLAALVVIAIPSVASTDMSTRLATFFALLAVCDFVKRLTFLAPDQAIWSQYVTFLFPFGYYCAFILVPFGLSRRLLLKSRANILTVLYVAVAMVNTWLAADFTFASKLTATALLIVPWTMLLIAAAYSEALHRVARVLLICGLVSAVYALSQLAFGPTVVELRWAEAVGEFSIGASHLASSLAANVPQHQIWRVNGLQPDALTFGILTITALASCQVLRCSRSMRAGLGWCASGVLALAITACLVRTIWIACIAFVAFSWLAYRLRSLLRPKVFVVCLVSLFVLSDLSSAYLREQAGLVPTVDNPYMNRAMVLGTVDARKNALQHFEEVVPRRLLFGSGYAASSWVGGKFGADEALQKDLASLTSHNVILELLWYVGLPGLFLFILLLYEIARCAHVALSRARPAERRTLAVIIGYVVAMFVTGLGNGGVFLSFYFFFFSGVLAAPDVAAQTGRKSAVIVR